MSSAPRPRRRVFAAAVFLAAFAAEPALPVRRRGRSRLPALVSWSFAHVFSVGGGVIYAIRENGDLLWYQDLLRDGSNSADGSSGWDLRGGVQIGKGWDYTLVFSGGDGVMFGVRDNGELVWHPGEFGNGTNEPDGGAGWAAGSGVAIGGGWEDVASAFTRGRFVYTVAKNGAVYRSEKKAVATPVVAPGLIADDSVRLESSLAGRALPVTPDPLEGSNDER